MNEPRTYTLIWQFQCPLVVQYWIWLAPFGIPFVTKCAVDDRLLLMRWLGEMAKTSGDEAIYEKMWLIRVRGVMGKKHYTWKERLRHNSGEWQYLDKVYLPAWEWKIRDYEVLSVEKAHPSLEWWFSFLTILQIIAFFALIFWCVSFLPK